MTDQSTPVGNGIEENTQVRFTDKRRIDPQTGEVRPDVSAAATDAAETAGPVPAGHDELAAELVAAQALAAERLDDLQRLQAEYVNYRKRVDRDRSLAHELAVVEVVEGLLPVLDDVDLARRHGELADGPFASIAEKFEAVLARFGWERYGETGEVFDPRVHDALMHAESPDATESTVTLVLQPGHKVGERIVRAARVAVTAPQE